MATDNGADNGSSGTPEPPKVVEVSEYVVVQDASGEILEIPTNPDNSLNMSSLQAAIAGATGLKYKNPKTGANRTVMVDSTGAKLLPPTDGWESKTFNAIVAVAPTPTRGADVSVKRRKMGDSDDEDDSEGEGRSGRKRLAESNPMVDRRPVDLIVLGINFKTTDEAFKAYFETFGPVAFAEVKRNAEGNSKGFGFVQMGSIDDQDKVLAAPSHSIDGRRCEVKLPDQRSQFTQFDQFASQYGSPHGKRMAKTTISKVFVGRLVEKITDSMLKEFFEAKAKDCDAACTITDVFIPSPFRGFGFVTFSSAEVADKICRRGNYVVEGVSIAVSLAVPKEASSAPGHYAPSPTPTYHNEQGFAYGYGKGGAGYPSPMYRKDAYGRYDQSPAALYGYDPTRTPYDSVWAQGTSTPQRPGAAHQWVTPRPSARRGGASPAYSPHPSTAGVHAPSYAPQPLIPPPPSTAPPPDSMVPSQIANGLDALDLNQKNNPELYQAAVNAFYLTLNGGTGGGPMPPRAPPPPPHWQK